MKVPDLSEAAGGGDSQKPKNIDLGAYRKKKKQSKHLLKLIVILLGVIAFALVWINASAIFEPLRGIASKVETKTSNEVGFPIELPGSSRYSLKRLGDTFSLLTDTYLYSYETTGAQIFAKKHGFSNPEQSTSEKRILLYDKAGYNFAVYSKSSLIFQKALDDKIIYTSIGNDGLAAVVTESERYSNVLYIYDDGGNWKYTKKFADENVMQVCSVGDDEHIIVSTISSHNGDISANFYRYSIKSTGNHEWKYSVPNGSLPCGMYADKSIVTAVCDNIVLSLNCDKGELNGSYDYSGVLHRFWLNDSGTVLQYNDISSNKNVLILLNASAEPTALTNVTSGTSCVYSDKSGIYVLDGAKMKIFDGDLITERDIAASDDDYSSFVKIGSSIIMLGYETRNMTEISE